MSPLLSIVVIKVQPKSPYAASLASILVVVEPRSFGLSHQAWKAFVNETTQTPRRHVDFGVLSSPCLVRRPVYDGCRNMEFFFGCLVIDIIGTSQDTCSRSCDSP
jgi:hypothetical protein